MDKEYLLRFRIFHPEIFGNLCVEIKVIG